MKTPPITQQKGPRKRPQGGPPKGAPQDGPRGLKSGEEKQKRKKRQWIQPKDKSFARKTFLKVRDAKARSHFFKLQKKANAAGAEGAAGAAGGGKQTTGATPIASANDNDTFLSQLMNPFGVQDANKEKESDNEQQFDNKKTEKHKEDAEAAVNSLARDPSKKKNKKEEKEEAAVAGDSDAMHADGRKGSLKEQKGYMPFLKAQKMFEAKQREKEAERIKRMEEKEKEMQMRRQKKRLNKITNKKLQARTRKGQPVMGNVLDVLLLKMQKNAQK